MLPHTLSSGTTFQSVWLSIYQSGKVYSRGVVKTALKLRVSKQVGNVLNTWATFRFPTTHKLDESSPSHLSPFKYKPF
jgi:hypothetical protein